MKLIKKYKNRKMYDLETSRYITLAELTEYVKNGVEFKIVDKLGNIDVTTLMLLRVLSEAQGTIMLDSAELQNEVKSMIIKYRHVQAMAKQKPKSITFVQTVPVVTEAV